MKKDTAVLCFIKANPPTVVHYQIFKKLISIAKIKDAHPLIFLSQEYDAKKNPIPWKLKVKYITEFLNNKVYVCDNESVKNVEDILEFIYQRGYKKIYFLTSSPMEDMINSIINKNKENKKFEFDAIEVISISLNDPDKDSSESTYSPSQARNAVLDNNLEKLKKIVIYKDEKQFNNLLIMLKSGLGLIEKIGVGKNVKKLIS